MTPNNSTTGNGILQIRCHSMPQRFKRVLLFWKNLSILTRFIGWSVLAKQSWLKSLTSSRKNSFIRRLWAAKNSGFVFRVGKSLSIFSGILLWYIGKNTYFNTKPSRLYSEKFDLLSWIVNHLQFLLDRSSSYSHCLIITVGKPKSPNRLSNSRSRTILLTPKTGLKGCILHKFRDVFYIKKIRSEWKNQVSHWQWFNDSIGFLLEVTCIGYWVEGDGGRAQVCN